MDRTLVLKVKRVLKGIQVQAAAPQLGEGEARLREKQCPNFFDRAQPPARGHLEILRAAV